jgi:nitrate reductase cytochrome c-type subunit
LFVTVNGRIAGDAAEAGMTAVAMTPGTATAQAAIAVNNFVLKRTAELLRSWQADRTRRDDARAVTVGADERRARKNVPAPPLVDHKQGL